MGNKNAENSIFFRKMFQDREEYPGSEMCGFISWVGKMKPEFKRIRPDCFTGPAIDDLNEWSAFLRGKAQERN